MYTAKKIAQDLGLSLVTVHLSMNGTYKGKVETMRRVQKYAEQVGYDPVYAKKGGVLRDKFIDRTRFGTYEEFISYCRDKRREGYTNKEIAQMVGCSIHTILSAIGKNPPEVNAIIYKQRGERKRIKNAEREERAKAIREAECKRLQENLQTLQKAKETTLENIKDMQEKYRVLWAQKYSNYKELLHQIEVVEKQIEGVA